MQINYGSIIKSVETFDVRFPTSLEGNGSDAIHTDPDYSLCYVILTTSDGMKGHGMTFTLGKGTNIVCNAVETMKFMLENQELDVILSDFGVFWRKLTSESQLRWLGPEKGIVHLACSAIINAIWDLWGKLENKPVWKLLSDMEPEFLVNCIDFRYCTDVLTKSEAVEILKQNRQGKQARLENLMKNGYLAYTTAPGWLGYSNEKMISLCEKYKQKGFTAFKIKIGLDLNRDIERCKLMRDQIGFESTFMLDSNQIFDVDQAIEWVKRLKDFKPLWIEEPTSPDDVLGHAKIAKALRPFNIAVASGEMIANRVIFKQFMQAGAFEFCQVDSARIGGVNELLIVYLMARKFNIKVCPHAGGVGLSEMIQHLQYWDYLSVSGTKEERFIEFVDQQHEHFVTPATIEEAYYIPPTTPGYSTELRAECIEKFTYPTGTEWVRMFSENIYPKP